MPKSMALTIDASAAEMLGASAVSLTSTPISPANDSRVACAAPSQCSYQADAPQRSQRSANSLSAARDRSASAPSEHVFRYVAERKIGNSGRYLSASS